MRTTAATDRTLASAQIVGPLVWRQAAGVVGFALATALAAQIRFYLPASPVPVTLQTLVVLLAGMTLGARLGTASMMFYLLLGVCGYHVFADSSWEASWQASYLLGPTGGYLLGFVLAQPLIGRLTRQWHGRWSAILAAALAGNAVIFISGLIWLGLWAGTTPAQTLALGLWPFIPGLLLKTTAATTAGRALQPISRKMFS